EARETVLPPAVCARAGVVVREVLPRRSPGAVVLAHGAPLALADVRAPLVPVAALPEAVLEPAERLDPLSLRAAHAGRDDAPSPSTSLSTHGSCHGVNPATRRSALSGPQVPGPYGSTGGRSSSSGCITRHASS